MKYSNFTSLVRFNTGSDSISFTDANIVLLTNVFIEDFAKKITEANEDYFGLESVTTLIAGQRQYSLPEELCNQIKRVEAKLDGTNWKVLNEIDLNLWEHTTDETTIQNEFQGKDSAFTLFGSTLTIYSGDPIIDVFEGLKLWSINFPQLIETADLSSTDDMSLPKTSQSKGLPIQFHELLARRVSIHYKSSKDRPIPLTDQELMFKTDFEETIKSITGANMDRSVIGVVPTVYDNGFNL